VRTIPTTPDLRNALDNLRKQDKRIGFVPTMGALHEGHRSLVKMSKQQTDVTVVSIFVNPTQFGPNEDFSRYPRTIEADESILIDEEVDFLFLPEVDQIYPAGHSSSIHIGPISSVFEGAIRPGHFDGVAIVVSILFNIVQPNVAFFGQKDAQQLAVIRKLIRDFAFPIDIIASPTIRDENGLALSSRNRYLSENEKNEALAIPTMLFLAKDLLMNGQSPADAKMASTLEFQRLAPNMKLDYLDIVDNETFQPKSSFDNRQNSPSATIIIAARIGATRLIDNLLI